MPFKLRWSTPLPAASYHAPVPGPALILAEHTWGVTVLNPSDGAIRWQVDAGSEPRQFAWANHSSAGPVMCAGDQNVWRVSAFHVDGSPRYSWILECVSSEAVAVGETLWLLSNREGNLSRLQQLDAAGTVLGSWEIPTGGCSLQVEESDLIFVSRASAVEGLYRFDTQSHQLLRLFTGPVDSVIATNGHRVIRGRDDRLTVLDAAGNRCWESGGLGLLPYAREQVFCSRQRDGVWRPSCLNLATGALIWEVEWPGASDYLQVVPFGEYVGVWDNSNVDLLDARTGARVQSLSCSSHAFSGVDPAGYRDGLLLLSEQEIVHCYEAV